MDVRWRAFPLHPETPPEGRLISDLFGNQPFNLDQMMAGLKKKANELGLPFGDRKKTYNSRLAQELGLWAESKDRGDEFHMAAFHGYFAQGKNLAQVPVLLDLAAEAGLSRDEANIVLTDRTFKDAVDADWALSREMMINAVPTFIINQDRLVGAQPFEMIEKMVVANGAGKR